jgi:tape measure domain-containing protein
MAAPELRLEVSLNLAGFRNEVRKLTQVAQNEFNPLLQVRLDTRDFRAQLKALEKIKPILQVNDSQLVAARARVGTLNKSLATLRRATSTPIEIKLKYVEVGKPPSAAAGQIGRAVSGGIRADQSVAELNRAQAVAARSMMKAANMPVGALGTGRSLEAYKKSIVEGMTNAGKESINGLASGLKEGNSEIATAAKKVGEAGVRAIKDTLGIASPSRVFKQIGEFSVDGLELGFLNGLKDFKGKSVAEIRKIVALMRFELAKISDMSGTGGPSMGSLRRQLIGQRAYTSPIGPQAHGSSTPWAAGTAGHFGYSGYEPRTVSRPYTGAPNFPSAGALLPGGPPATAQGAYGGTPFYNTALGAVGGYNPGVRSSAMFPMSGMMGPSSPLGRITPQSSMFSGGAGGGGGGGSGGGGGGGAFGGMRLNVPQLPGSGVVRELGTEFGFAAKQVLLFGTAYKALAFLQSFPGQVGDAVGALQSFRNTLGAISPSAEEAAASSQFILDIADKYNTPLQSARDGFTKLYASMKPTGFSGGEIRDLFLGISQAAATFGMSADKVDRVNYAFAQMASKGQVMSEELKGQLGDVLPGAMGIFAEAAGFEGPEAITKFSKALEDGAYKGAAMKTLLTNVGIIMRKEFGPGAEGAARTFQGVINRMQNSLTLLYESFEPVAVGFLNAVVMPMTSGIKTVTDGFKAFFTGQAAQTAGGSVFAKQLEALRPAFEGIAANIKQILPLLQSFASTALSLGQALLQIAGNPFVGYLARIYLSVLPLTMALRVLNLQVLIPLIGSFLRAIPAFISFNAAMMSGVGTNRALIATMQLTGQTAGVTAGRIRLVSAALATLGSTAILAGIGLLVERFLMMKGAIDGVRQSTQQMLGSISGMANSGAVRELKNVGQDLQKQRGTFEELRSFVSGGAIAGGKERLTEAGAKKFEEVGMGSFVKKDVFGKPYIADFLRASEIIEEKLKGLNKQSSKVQEKLPLAAKVAADLAKQAQSAQTIAPIPEAPGDGKKKKEQSLESYYSLQDTLAKNAADFAAAQTEEEFRHKVELLEMYYDIQETRANAYQRDALRFEREMVMIEARRQEARLKAQLDVQRAQSSVAGGAGGGGGGAGSGGKGLGAGIAQYITGDPSSPFYKADHGGGNYHEHLAFVSREAAEEAYKKLTSAGIKVTEFKGKSRVGKHTPGSAHYEGLAFDVPGAQVPVGRERELTARVQSTLGIGGTRPAPVPASQKRDAVAEQKTLQASIAKTATERMADAKAAQEQIVALEKYRTSAFPTVEQEMQNKLLAKRNELFRSGMTDEQIDKEIKLYENQERGTAALATVQRLYDGNIIKLEKYNELMAIFNRDIATQNTLLQENAAAMAQAKFDQTIKGIRDQLAMARSITPEEEMRTQIAQEGYVGDQAESVFQERKTLQEAQKLKEDLQGIASSIGNSFGEAFKGIITGSMTAQQALAGMFQSIADSFADMAAQMIAEYVRMQALGLLKTIFGVVAPALGAAAGGLSSGFSAGGSSAIDTSAGGWGAAFNTPLKFANGGIASGGFTAFANGGMVTGPTMGLVGEGRYNEAIIPLPDGKSVPVQLAGGAGGNAAPVNTSIVVNVKNGQADSQMSGNQGNQLARELEGAVRQVILKESRPGGLISSSR